MVVTTENQVLVSLDSSNPDLNKALAVAAVCLFREKLPRSRCPEDKRSSTPNHGWRAPAAHLLSTVLCPMTHQIKIRLNSLNVADQWTSMVAYMLSHMSMDDTKIPPRNILTEFLQQRARVRNASDPRYKPNNVAPLKGKRLNRQPHHAFQVEGKPEIARAPPTWMICAERHFHVKCPTLLGMTPQARSATLKKLDVCTKCLNPSHTVNACKNERVCSTCNKKHHNLLHFLAPQQQGEVSVQHVHSHSPPLSPILATALIHVKNSVGSWIPLRTFLDMGATGQFLTEKAQQRLNLRKKAVDINITGFAAASAGKTRGLVAIELGPHFKSSFTTSCDAFVVKKITDQLPSCNFNPADWPHLTGIQLADPKFHVPGDIDILLGVDMFFSLLQSKKIAGPVGTPYAIQTQLGWIVAGAVSHDTLPLKVLQAEVDSELFLHHFWESKFLHPTLLQEEYMGEGHNFQTSKYKRDPSSRDIVSRLLKFPSTNSQRCCVTRPTYSQTDFRGRRCVLPAEDPTEQTQLLSYDSRCTAFQNREETTVFKAQEARETLGHMKQLTAADKAHTPFLKFLPSRRFQPEVDLERTLHRFWQFESLPKKTLHTEEEREAEQHFLQIHKRDPSGRYIVSIPMKIPPIKLGSSREIALRRFFNIEKRLLANPEAREAYTKFMGEYEALGHMKQLTAVDKAQAPFRNFLPHHFVLKSQSEMSKFRVVFDGSAKTSNGFSFNDTQLVGPTIQSTLYTTLMRFRLNQVAFTADIAKMYRQVLVTPHQQNLQCIHWRKSPTEPVKEFKLLTVTYGTASAPFLATRVLHQLANDEQGSFPLASRVALKDFYVDDCMSGAQTVAEVKEIIQQLISMLLRGGMSLRKFASNVPEALQDVPEALRESTPILSMEEDNVVKALGLHWNTKTDEFFFKTHPFEAHPQLTKRIILSEISRLFDPIGWLAPAVVSTKILMQDLWKAGVGWDKAPPQHLCDRWTEFKQSMKTLELIRIPRCIQPGFSTLELHGFCDASEKAYAAVLYVRAEGPTGIVSTLLTSKTRVSPLKTVSIPRLELCGALLLAELINSVLSSMQINFTKVKAWTDSTIVLSWIRASASRWKTFVGNRVSKIQEILPGEHWSYVNTLDNPADCASRGISSVDLQTHPLWWSGPKWLTDNVPFPHYQIPNIDPLLANEEEKRETLVVNAIVSSTFTQKFSSLLRLKWVTAFMLRFINNCREKRKEKKLTGLFTAVELSNSFHLCIKLAQAEEFPQEVHALSNNESLLKSSPFMDSNGLLRVGGRLPNADVPMEKMTPILLPRHQHITKLNIQQLIRKLLRGGMPIRKSPSHISCPLDLPADCASPGISSEEPQTHSLSWNCSNSPKYTTFFSASEACLNFRPLTQVSTDPSDFTALTPAHFLIGGPLHAVPEPDFTSIPVNRLKRWNHLQQIVQHFWHRWSQDFLTRLQQRPKWRTDQKDVEKGDVVLVKRTDCPQPLGHSLVSLMSPRS